MNLPTYEEIKPYIERKLVDERVHPEDENVRIFNYTQTCQFSGEWDDVTRQCRGLIMNIATGEVLARPFPKFFNYGEHQSKGWDIPKGVPCVYEKLDGSLGILYELNGKAWIATRGSFVSEQAVWATNWWREHVNVVPVKGHTHLFEIIYPENRIVVNYDFSGLVHLATLDKDGRAISWSWPEPVRSVRKIDITDLEELAKLDEPNSEGFVCHFEDEDVRLKIKFPEYVRLHKLVTGLSEIAIWENLREGKGTDELLEKVPDEFFQWVKGVQERLVGEFMAIEGEAREHFARIEDLMHSALVGGGSRKEWAEQIQRMKHPALGFHMLDKKDYSHIIWKMIRPHGQSSFKVDIDS